jgi:hypothetical protein
MQRLPWWKVIESGPFLWRVSIGLLIAGLVGLYLADFSSDSIRRVGFVYEAVGLLSVGLQVLVTRKKHSLSGIGRQLVDSIREAARELLAPPPRKLRLAPESGSYEMKGQEATFGTGKVEPADEQTRILKIEERLSAQHEQLNELKKNLHIEAQARLDSYAAFEGNLTALKGQTDEAIAAIETGHLNLTTVGLWWLLFGLFLTTLTPEVFAFLRWLGLADVVDLAL